MKFIKIIVFSVFIALVFFVGSCKDSSELTFSAPNNYDFQDLDDVFLFYKYIGNNTVKSSIILTKPAKDFNLELFDDTDNTCSNSEVIKTYKEERDDILIKRNVIKCVKTNYNIISDKVLFIDGDYVSQAEFLIDEDFYNDEKSTFENVLESVSLE